MKFFLRSCVPVSPSGKRDSLERCTEDIQRGENQRSLVEEYVGQGQERSGQRPSQHGNGKKLHKGCQSTDMDEGGDLIGTVYPAGIKDMTAVESASGGLRGGKPQHTTADMTPSTSFELLFNRGATVDKPQLYWNRMQRRERVAPWSEDWVMHEKAINEGATCAVYRCRPQQERAGRYDYVAKHMKFHGDGACSAASTVSGEAAILYAAQHLECVVDIIGLYISEQQQEAYLVLRRLTGCTLRQFVDPQRQFAPSSVFSRRETPEQRRQRQHALAKQVGRQLFRALQQVHSLGICHNDISYNNIFVNKTANGQLRLTLLDFGVSYDKLLGSRPHLCVGTEPFMSPEMLDWELLTPHNLDTWRTPDTASDMWSAAITLLFCATGMFPFVGYDSKAIRESQAEWFELTRDAVVYSEIPEHRAQKLIDSLEDPHATDFYMQLLRYDPATRMTAGQCINHPYLTESPTQLGPRIYKVSDRMFPIGRQS